MWPWRSKEGGNSGGSSSSKPAPPIDDRAEASSPPSTPPLPSTSSPPPSPSTPSARLSAAWRAATARVSPGDPIPPRPPQLGEWAANTVLCAGAGAAFCGWREAAAAAAAEATAAAATAGATATSGGSTSKAAAAALARAIAEEKTRKLVRIGSEAIRGAGRFGSLAALFWALQLGSGVARGEPALVADSALAAAVTGAVFGLGALPRGSPASARLRSSLLGAALGAGVAVPAAAAQKVLLGFLPEEEKKKKNESGGGDETSGGDAETRWERTEAAASPFSPVRSSSSSSSAASPSSSSSSSAATILAVAKHLESSLNNKSK